MVQANKIKQTSSVAAFVRMHFPDLLFFPFFISEKARKSTVFNWVHGKRRGSERSTFLAIFWGFLIVSVAPVFSRKIPVENP